MLIGFCRADDRHIEALAKPCAQIKADGFALDDGEYIEEVRCLAAPFETGTVQW